MKKYLAFMLFAVLNFLGVAGASEWREGDFLGIKFDKNKGENMKILIIGANGSVAKEVTAAILEGTNASVRLFLRNATRLNAVKSAYPSRVELIEGDATDKTALKVAMSGVNIVYANLAGDLVKMADAITGAMRESFSQTPAPRLIWISSYGIYQNEYREIPTRSEGAIHSALKSYATSAKIVENSGLNYTIIRPQWFSNADEIDYELTKKGEAFKNPDALISRKSIAHLIVRLCFEPGFGVRESFGINKPAR